VEVEDGKHCSGAGRDGRRCKDQPSAKELAVQAGDLWL
jgi:hypothetical protein